MGRRWTCPALGPPTRDLVFLTNARLVLKPEFYRRALREVRADFFRFGGKAPFLNASSVSVS